MHITLPKVGAVDSLLMTGWAHGPAVASDGALHVALTEFRSAHRSDLPGIIAAGFRLRQGWTEVPGAVAVALWLDVSGRRLGSVSVWTAPEHLGRWVSTPDHVEIMNRYRSRGTVRITSWECDAFNRSAVERQARQHLADPRRGLDEDA